MKRIIAIVLILAYFTGCSHTQRVRRENSEIINHQLQNPGKLEWLKADLYNGVTLKLDSAYIDNDSLYYTMVNNATLHRLSMNEVRYISRYDRGMGFLDGLWMGWCAGTIGLSIAMSAGGGEYRNFGIVLGAMWGAIIGIPSGGVLGFMFGSRERYKLVPEPKPDKPGKPDNAKWHEYNAINQENIEIVEDKNRIIIADEIIEKNSADITVLFGERRVKLPVRMIEIIKNGNEIRIKMSDRLYRRIIK